MKNDGVVTRNLTPRMTAIVVVDKMMATTKKNYQGIIYPFCCLLTS